ncbi:MAG: dTDP-4-dehydrorhamnose 3,5-epimerase [Fimbriimonas sp.]|nr:dTDP-4-dehydrorhamnose 3,5-epimerase [Fimbriimonas sp.]
MTVEPTELPEVLLIEPRVFGDSRGYFFEAFNALRYREAGIEWPFVQDNVSFSSGGVVRGLHYQWPSAQDKLIQVLDGAILDVAVDVRLGSPRFGKWIGRVLSSENHRQLFIPVGFAHGFAVIGDRALVSYKCSTPYDPANEVTVLWSDPEIGVEWGIDSPTVSAKDQAGLSLAAVPPDRLPTLDPLKNRH